MTFDITGPAELVGPAAVTAEGGMCGTYVRTTGQSGQALLKVTAPGTEEVTVTFDIIT